jgi:hypothetical protein
MGRGAWWKRHPQGAAGRAIGVVTIRMPRLKANGRPADGKNEDPAQLAPGPPLRTVPFCASETRTGLRFRATGRPQSHKPRRACREPAPRQRVGAYSKELNCLVCGRNTARPRRAAPSRASPYAARARSSSPRASSPHASTPSRRSAGSRAIPRGDQREVELGLAGGRAGQAARTAAGLSGDPRCSLERVGILPIEGRRRRGADKALRWYLAQTRWRQGSIGARSSRKLRSGVSLLPELHGAQAPTRFSGSCRPPAADGST